MSHETGKHYGLVLSKKGSGQDIIRPSVFDEESDSGDSGTNEGDWVKKSYQREAAKSVEKRHTKIQIQKALSQDPSIFQYDEVYDDIKDEVSQTAPKKEEKKQSRYTQSLKRNAERRKLENERRLERQVQKERLDEGEEFKDKETFVTSSYKKKLEEFQKMDEEEKRMDRLEEIGDVSKQKDISGFYRHLYKTMVDGEKPVDKKDVDIKKEEDGKIEFAAKKSLHEECNKNDFKSTDNHKKQKRQYRKRTKSGSSREEGEKTSSSSCSSSSSSSSIESEDELKSKYKKKGKEDKSRSSNKSPDKKKRSKGKENVEILVKSIEGENKKKKYEIIKDKINSDPKSESVLNVKSVQDSQPFVNIWLKRTVGSTFDDALRRYLERKSKRQGSY